MSSISDTPRSPDYANAGDWCKPPLIQGKTAKQLIFLGIVLQKRQAVRPVGRPKGIIVALLPEFLWHLAA